MVLSLTEEASAISRLGTYSLTVQDATSEW